MIGTRPIFASDACRNRRFMANSLMVVALLFGIAIAWVPAVSAQTTSGTITGTVSDPKGLSMQNVNVLVHSTDTGLDRTVQTNESGIYVAGQLPPGHYDITANNAGFATVTHKDVNLLVDQVLTIDIQLPVATQTGEITVTAATPVVETEKTEQSQDVSQTLVEGLPINGRRWENFVLLTPAVTTDGTSGLSSFRGISGLYNGNSVDGANNTQAFFSEARGRTIIVSYVYSADSIQEFEVAASNYSAEFGQAAGGVVNAITRSGTNQYHGDLFYNLRYPTLNALDPVAKESAASSPGGIASTTQTVHQQNQFGGSFGGPILKDKLFFFVTYDGFRKVNPIDYTTSQVSPSISNLVCPLQITSTQCASAKAFVNNDLLGPFARNLKQDIGFGKLDYQLNQANHLNLLYNLQDWGEPFGYNTSPTVSNQGSTENAPGGTHERFLIASWNAIIGSNKVNEARFQWGRDFEFDGSNASGPLVALTSLFGYGVTSALPRPAFPDEHRYQVSDNFSFVKGPHAFKAGVDLNFIHEYLVNLFQGDGNYNYTSPVAIPAAGCVDPAAQTANTIFCDWLVDAYGVNLGDGLTRQHYGTFSQATDVLNLTKPGLDDFYDKDYAGYLEDTWKLRPNLTLNLGVRYDVQDIPQPARPNTATPLLALYTSKINIDKGDIAPRLGIAWQPARNTVLRVSYGIFYGKTSNSTYYAMRVENGVVQQTISGCAPGSTNPILKGCSPLFPNVLFTPPGLPLAAPFAGALAPVAVLPAGGLPSSSAAAHGMDPNFVNPRAHEGEVTFERQLPGSLAVSASYLVTRGLHLPADIDSNLAPATTTRSYDVLAGSTAGSATTQTTTVPFYTARQPGNTATGIIETQLSVVNSWYHAMVLTLRKPMSHGIELLANYTFSRAMDDGEISGGQNTEFNSGTFFGNDGVLDPYNIKGDYAHSDLDQRNRFVGSFVWTPTYGRNAGNRAERELIYGWSLSGIVTSGSGQPYSAIISTSAPQPGGINGGETGAVIGTNASAIGGRVSFLPRNSFNLPGFTNIDFRIARAFTFRERYSFEIRGEAFNLFNSTIISQVNTSAYSLINAGTGVCAGHANACLVPLSTFQTPLTTSSTLYGARQLQIGARFSF